MVFSSMTFLVSFLPLCTGVYFLCKKRGWRNGVLLAFSLLFYAWGEPKCLVLIVSAALAAWLGGICMCRFPRRKKLFFVCTVILLTANLAVFKYLNFLVRTAEELTGFQLGLNEIALPIGISFYTFQILSYVIDLYRGEIALQKNPLKLLLYVTLFPQLIAGPIVRYKTVETELSMRNENLSLAASGCRRFIAGLAKKVIIADSVGRVAKIVYSSSAGEYGTLIYWLAALAYTFQIYYDFSGYSDMAIGLGRIFGFHFQENFDYPYASLSVTEFWRRWHISLSRWFRDYIYIPLGGSRTTRLKWLRNIVVVWGLTGLWHGADWNFILWGLYFAALLILEKLILGKILARLPKAVGWIYTFIAVNVSWVIFNLSDLGELGSALKMMFVYRPTSVGEAIMANTAIVNGALFLPLAAVFAFPVVRAVRRRFTVPEQMINLGCFALLLLCLVFIVSSSFNPFIYFRF